MIPKKDRERIRKKQDKLIKLAEKLHVPEHYRISPDYEGSPTIAELRKFIFLDWEEVIDNVLNELKEARR